MPRLTDAARVVVVEDGDQIVATQILQPILHAEGLWIHPAYRRLPNAPVLRRLWRLTQRTVRDVFHVPGFVTSADCDDVRHLLRFVGATPLPESYAVQMEKP